MPNGEQALEQDHEGEDSAEESGEWESPADGDEVRAMSRMTRR